VHRVIGAGGENWSDEYRFRTHDGGFPPRTRPRQVIRDEAGRAMRMIGAMADITSRKQAEERIHTRRCGSASSPSSASRRSRAPTWRRARRAVELVTVALKADYCNVLELDESGKQLLIKAASGWPSEIMTRRSVPIRPGAGSSSCFRAASL